MGGECFSELARYTVNENETQVELPKTCFSALPKPQKYILVNLEVVFFDLTDVCPLLTKQYIQVGLQIQYMSHNF
jgi:hypothetical protein